MTAFSFHRSAARVACGLALTLAFLQAHAQSQADGYPSKPIKMVVGFAPGGPTDVVARIIAQRMSEKLGQPIIIDNRPGAGSNLAATANAKETPDGYSLFYNTSSITIAPWTYGKVGYDPVKDFTPVVLTTEMPLVLAITPSFPAESLPKFVELLKANPGKYNYGSSGSGAIEHLTSAQFVSMYDLKTTHVPYRGTAPALVDLMAGQTQFMMTTFNTALPHARDGKIKILAVTSKRRSPVLPNVPTVSEALSTNFESTAWQGIVAPANTPQAIVQKLNKAVNEVLHEKPIQQKLAQQGVDALGGTSEQYAAFIKSEYARWEQVVRKTGARAD